jgi:hypothetical protein
METINTLAAKYNLFTENNLPKEWQSYWNDHMNGYQQAKEISIPEFFTNTKNFECGLFFKCLKSEGNYYHIEYCGILVKSKNSNLLCMLQKGWRTNDKYTLTPLHELINEYSRNIDHYSRQEIYNKTIKPNLIGVFTEKKVSEWVNYCHDLLIAYKDKNEVVNNKAVEAEKKVTNFINSLNGNCTVQVHDTSKDNKCWYIQTQMFYVTFKLDLKSGFLSEIIKFEGNLENITTIANK